MAAKTADRTEFTVVPLSSYLNSGRKGATTVLYANVKAVARYAPVSPGKYVVLARDPGGVPVKVGAFVKA